MIATIIAIVISSLGLKISEDNFVIRIFSLLGAMTIPLLFLILGGNIYNDFREKGKLFLMETIKFVIIKNFIFPLIFLGILFYLKEYIPFHIGLILIIQSAVPPLTAIPIVTKRVGGNRNIVNQFIVASFSVSLVSIPLMIFLFSQIYHIS